MSREFCFSFLFCSSSYFRFLFLSSPIRIQRLTFIFYWILHTILNINTFITGIKNQWTFEDLFLFFILVCACVCALFRIPFKTFSILYRSQWMVNRNKYYQTTVAHAHIQIHIHSYAHHIQVTIINENTTLGINDLQVGQ